MYRLESQAVLEFGARLRRECRWARIAPAKARRMIAVVIAFAPLRRSMNDGSPDDMAFSQCGLPSTNANGRTKISSPASSLTCRAH